MDVVVVGGHGKIALLLHPLLAARGDRVRGVIRNPDHADAVRAAGAEPVVCDLEDDAADLAGALHGADAIVFAAGAGPGSGPERKRTLDLGGVRRTVEAAPAAGVGRYVLVSSMGADPTAPDDGGFGTYLRAKGEADELLLRSGLDATVVRPGHLTDDGATGRVALGSDVGEGSVPRADVAAVLAAVLVTPSTVGRSFELVGGEDDLEAAVAGLWP